VSDLEFIKEDIQKNYDSLYNAEGPFLEANSRSGDQ
jgi:hypothetical protein